MIEIVSYFEPGFVNCRIKGPKSKFDIVQGGINVNTYSWDTVLREMWRDWQSTPESGQSFDESGYVDLNFVASEAEVADFNSNPIPFEFLLDKAILSYPLEAVIIKKDG